MSEKRHQLINTALDLFYAHGINSVGINEVLSTSGIAKKTLYHHFGSKEALIMATLEYRDAVFSGWYHSLLAGHDNDVDRVTSLFNGLTDWFNGQVEILGAFRGCYFINTVAEWADADSDIHRYCYAHKQGTRQLLKRALDRNSDTVIDTLMLMKEGAIVTAQFAQDSQAAERCLPVVASLFRR